MHTVYRYYRWTDKETVISFRESWADGFETKPKCMWLCTDTHTHTNTHAGTHTHTHSSGSSPAVHHISV